MEVTVRGMDATFEHPGTDLLRVTGMIVLNGYAELKFPNIYKRTKDSVGIPTKLWESLFNIGNAGAEFG
ncbi:hypothetical protein ACRN9J_09465 [Shewanella baltica]|uniref:hypothetical protein n=1 Tax=Shewanella baltica TaxID=62322 RepID=UPI003D7921C6